MKFFKKFFNEMTTKRIFLFYILSLIIIKSTENSMITNKKLVEEKSKIENKENESYLSCRLRPKELIDYTSKIKLKSYESSQKNVGDIIDFIPIGTIRGVVIDSSSSEVKISII